jgi:hypothetical protein
MSLSVNVVTTVHEKFLGSRFNLIIRNVPIKIMTTDIDHFTFSALTTKTKCSSTKLN